MNIRRNKKKKNEISTSSQRIRILVTEEDLNGQNIMTMSDFFLGALKELSESIEYTSDESLMELPLSDIGILNETIHAIGVFRSPDFDLIPDFASLPNEIQKKYKEGKLMLGESRQVDGNIRAVLVDVDSKERVKDITFKKVQKADVSNDIINNMITQMQLRQISSKLDDISSEQEYLVEFSRNQSIIKPFLNARDHIKQAQMSMTKEDQIQKLGRATEELQDAINAVYVDMTTIEGMLAKSAKKGFFSFRRGNEDKLISRYTTDLQVLTKYVGLQARVYQYLGDTDSINGIMDAYNAKMRRLFSKGVIHVDKSIALYIHENIEYNKNNMDCWYNMEKEIGPMLEPANNMLEEKDLFVITMEENDNE